MDKYVSKKHTKERELRGCRVHASLILMEHVSLQMSLHSHSTLQSYTLRFRYASHENATFSILVLLRQTRYQREVLEA